MEKVAAGTQEAFRDRNEQQVSSCLTLSCHILSLRDPNTCVCSHWRVHCLSASVNKRLALYTLLHVNVHSRVCV